MFGSEAACTASHRCGRWYCLAQAWEEWKRLWTQQGDQGAALGTWKLVVYHHRISSRGFLALLSVRHPVYVYPTVSSEV